MKRLISFFIALFILTGIYVSSVQAAVPQPPVVSSQSVMMINARTGEKIYSKKSDIKIKTYRLLPVMVSLVIRERKALDEYVLVSKVPYETETSSSNTMKLYSGEKMKVRDLLTLLLLSGDEDSVMSLASSVASTEEEFSNLMQEKAIELGMNDTKITGMLKDAAVNDYTTVSDMATAMRAFSEFRDLLEICGETSVNFTPTNIAPEVRTLDNTNLQIYTQAHEYYDKAKAGIISSKDEEGTFISCASDGDQFFIIALSETNNIKDVYKNSKVLFDYGFNNYVTKLIIPKGTKLQEWPLKDGTILDLVSGKDFYFTTERENAAILNRKHSINFKPKAISGDDFAKGEEMGTAEVILDSKTVGEIPLLAERDVEVKKINPEDQTDKYHFVRIWVVRFLLGGTLLVIIVMIIRVWNKMKRSRIKQARLKKRRTEYRERKKLKNDDIG